MKWKCDDRMIFSTIGRFVEDFNHVVTPFVFRNDAEKGNIWWNRLLFIYFYRDWGSRLRSEKGDPCNRSPTFRPAKRFTFAIATRLIHRRISRTPCWTRPRSSDCAYSRMFEEYLTLYTLLLSTYLVCNNSYSWKFVSTIRASKYDNSESLIFLQR